MASPQMNAIVWETSLPGIQFLNRGKVRDLYEVGDRLLIVATDRLSAFDVVLPTPIPDKGRVLTQLSLFWFDLLRDVIPNHVLTADRFPAGTRCLPRATRRPLHALPKNKAAADRMRRARLPVGLGMEGLSRHRESLRNFAAGGPSGNPSGCRKPFSRPRPRPRRDMTRTFRLTRRHRGSAANSPNAFAP